MSLQVDIEKQLGEFRLQVRFDTDRQPLALLGASGSGKTLTLRCIAGVLKPDRGRIVLNGRVLFDQEQRIDLPPQRRRVGYLFQQYALFPHMTVRQNIGAAVGKNRQCREITDQLLKRFRLEQVAEQRPGQISGGQQQRTALARILASSPELILLDEPLSALDGYLRYQVELELLEFLESFPGSVVWVSHDRSEVYRNCPRVCVLDQGKSQPVITREELLHQPRSQAAARLSGCQNVCRAVPRDGGVFLPEWGLTLACSSPLPPEFQLIGIRARAIHPDPAGVLCLVRKKIRDIDTVILLLQPEGAADGAPLLRMELPGASDPGPEEGTWLRVGIDPKDVMFLRE